MWTLKGRKYFLWIEAEQWPDDLWTPLNANSDVIVKFENGERWVATFFSYQNILSLAKRNRDTGEYLGGNYFVATDMILIDEVSRERLEEVVADLIKENDFESCFALCKDIADDTV